MARSRCLIASAALAAGPTLCFAQTINDAGIPLSSHATGLSLPTGMEFLGRSPTDFFVIEKNSGQVKRYDNGTVSVALDLAVANDSERGLLGIAKDPNFASNNFVYLYYSKASGADGTSWVQNQLSRFTWNSGSGTLGSEVQLKTFGTSSDGLSSGPNHDAGPIAFGPDGKLYGMTGDLNRNRAEQNNQAASTLSASVGGIYRLTTNANGTVSVPADNPFVASPTTAFHQWYAYGVRNSFGMAFDPLTGALWDTENGPDVYDEINRVEAGFNSGWNKIMGPDSRDPQGLGDLVNLPSSSYSDPEFSFLSPVAVTGIDFLANSTIDANYRDALLVGSNNNGGELFLYRLNGNRDGFTALPAGLEDLVADSTAEKNLVRFGQSFTPVTEITTGPDGGIYIVRLGSFATPNSGAITRLGLKSWKLDADGAWETAANWQGGAPSDSNDYAAFFETISAPRTVTYNITKSLRGMIFNSPHQYTITGAPPFGLSAGAGTAYLRVLEGSHTIDKPVYVASSLAIDVLPANAVMTITGAMSADSVTITKGGAGTVEVPALVRTGSLVTPNLTINGGTFKITPNGAAAGTSHFGQLTANSGKFDLTNNRAVLTSGILGGWNGSAYTDVIGRIASGRNNGTWDGNGIVTSMSDAQLASMLTTIGVATAAQVLNIGNTQSSPWSGQTVRGDDVLLMYTYAGDANLSGFIDADDFFQIDSNYGDPSNSATSYFNGDFNYDGSIDGDDYHLIDANYVAQGAPLYPGTAAGASPVPEPGNVALLTLAAGTLTLRRRGGGLLPFTACRRAGEIDSLAEAESHSWIFILE